MFSRGLFSCVFFGVGRAKVEPRDFFVDRSGHRSYCLLCGIGELAPGDEGQMRQIGVIFQAMQAAKMALAELPQRCLFSSDAPYGEPLLARRLVEYMSPSPAIAAAVLGENTQRVLNLIG